MCKTKVKYLIFRQRANLLLNIAQKFYNAVIEFKMRSNSNTGIESELTAPDT